MSRYTQSEKDIMDSWYPPSQAERFQEFAKAGTCWDTERFAKWATGDSDAEKLDAVGLTDQADRIRRDYGQGATSESGGNVGAGTKYYADGSFIDAQHNNIGTDLGTDSDENPKEIKDAERNAAYDARYDAMEAGVPDAEDAEMEAWSDDDQRMFEDYMNSLPVSERRRLMGKGTQGGEHVPTHMLAALDAKKPKEGNAGIWGHGRPGRPIY